MSASRKLSRLAVASQLILCAHGISLCVYAYHVETTKEKDTSYKAMCDFSETMSCSRVFTSRYGRGFGLLEYVVGRDSVLNQPNSVFGVVFYIIQISLVAVGSLSAASAQVVLAVVANFGSVYLAYILYFVLQDFCVVCVSTYTVNFLLLLASILRKSQLTSPTKNKKKD